MGRGWSWGGRSTTTTRRAEKDTPGCMSTVLQLLFDSHQFHFPLHQPCFNTPNSPYLPEDPTFLKGLEAPRNSLESGEDPCMGTMRLSSITEEGELNLPISIRLGTKFDNARRRATINEGCVEEISSPLTKTPNLVARLMGLDLLPETPSATSYSLHTSGRSGTRSLPDTPRSSSARRSSDTDPRLSLQMNKENLMIPPEEFAFKSRKKEWRQGDESRSPNYYAREIVKQVKDSVGRRRKMGLDITNTTRNGSICEGNSPTIKPQKTRFRDESSPGKNSTPSRSPRLRLSEQEKKIATTTSTNHDHCSQVPRPFSHTSLSPSNQPATTTKCKKGSSSSERFTRPLKKTPQISNRNMREEAFVGVTPATKTNLSDQNCTKQCSTNQKPVAQGSKQRSQLSSCLSQKYKRQEGTEMLAHQNSQEDNNGKSKNHVGLAELRYVKVILKSTGIYRDAFVSVTRWFSPPHHLLNPLIFHHLELYSEENKEGKIEIDLGPIKHRCNRKLMFDLVDEILVEVSRPYLKMKPWLCSIHRGLFLLSPLKEMTGLQLLERLWSRIQSFPAANCQILEDIDALVEKDLVDANMRTVLSYSEEAENIVFEIERHILDSLLHEIAAAFVFVG